MPSGSWSTRRCASAARCRLTDRDALAAAPAAAAIGTPAALLVDEGVIVGSQLLLIGEAHAAGLENGIAVHAQPPLVTTGVIVDAREHFTLTTRAGRDGKNHAARFHGIHGRMLAREGVKGERLDEPIQRHVRVRCRFAISG